MSEVKLTVEIPGLDELLVEMRKQNELLATMTDKPVVHEPVKVVDTSSEAPESSETPEAEDDTKLAGRRTYVFFKDTKTGTIVEKGEEVPTHDGATGVSKTKWEKLCEKYDLDPETGKKNEAEPESDDDDDLDLPGGEPESSDDEDLGLGLDDQEDAVSTDLTIEDVKPVLLDVMKAKGRESVLKILKAHGASNVENIKPEDFGSIIEQAKKALA